MYDIHNRSEAPPRHRPDRDLHRTVRLLRRQRGGPGHPDESGRRQHRALELVVAGYAFMYAAGLVTGGRLRDLLGRRRVLITGLTAFAVTSALCGPAPNAGAV